MRKIAALLSGTAMATLIALGLVLPTASASVASTSGTAGTVSSQRAFHGPRGVSFRHLNAKKAGRPIIFRRPVLRAALSGTGNLEYLGGPIQSDVRVHLLFWGNWW